MGQQDNEFTDYLATAAEMLDAEGMREASALLRLADSRVEETGYDNWDGGTMIWTIHLLVEPSEYARLGAQRKVLQEQIMGRLKPVLERFTRDLYSVKNRAEGRMPPGLAHTRSWHFPPNSAEANQLERPAG